jgi:hypothetical protein
MCGLWPPGHLHEERLLVSNDVKTEEPSILAAPKEDHSAKADSEQSLPRPDIAAGSSSRVHSRWAGCFADIPGAADGRGDHAGAPARARYVTKDILKAAAANQIVDGALMCAGGRPYALVMFIDIRALHGREDGTGHAP